MARKSALQKAEDSFWRARNQFRAEMSKAFQVGTVCKLPGGYPGNVEFGVVVGLDHNDPSVVRLREQYYSHEIGRYLSVSDIVTDQAKWPYWVIRWKASHASK